MSSSWNLTNLNKHSLKAFNEFQHYSYLIWNPNSNQIPHQYCQNCEEDYCSTEDPRLGTTVATLLHSGLHRVRHAVPGRQDVFPGTGPSASASQTILSWNTRTKVGSQCQLGVSYQHPTCNNQKTLNEQERLYTISIRPHNAEEIKIILVCRSRYLTSAQHAENWFCVLF